MSSVKSNGTHPGAESIIENLHALNISIKKREKELAMREDSSHEELERRRLALISAETQSINSAIPCETESGGQATP